MKLLKYVFLVIALVGFGCNDSQDLTFCHIDSIDDLSWLKVELHSKGYLQPSAYFDVLVYRASYLGQEVVYIDLCCPACNVAPPQIRSCGGESLGLLNVDIDSNDLINKRVIWRSLNGFCS